MITYFFEKVSSRLRHFKKSEELAESVTFLAMYVGNHFLAVQWHPADVEEMFFAQGLPVSMPIPHHDVGPSCWLPQDMLRKLKNQNTGGPRSVLSKTGGSLGKTTGSGSWLVGGEGPCQPQVVSWRVQKSASSWPGFDVNLSHVFNGLKCFWSSNCNACLYGWYGYAVWISYLATKKTSKDLGNSCTTQPTSMKLIFYILRCGFLQNPKISG